MLLLLKERCPILGILVVLINELCLGHSHWMLVRFP